MQLKERLTTRLEALKEESKNCEMGINQLVAKRNMIQGAILELTDMLQANIVEDNPRE